MFASFEPLCRRIALRKGVTRHARPSSAKTSRRRRRRTHGSLEVYRCDSCFFYRPDPHTHSLCYTRRARCLRGRSNTAKSARHSSARASSNALYGQRGIWCPFPPFVLYVFSALRTRACLLGLRGGACDVTMRAPDDWNDRHPILFRAPRARCLLRAGVNGTAIAKKARPGPHYSFFLVCTEARMPCENEVLL